MVLVFDILYVFIHFFVFFLDFSGIVPQRKMTIDVVFFPSGIGPVYVFDLELHVKILGS